MTILSEKNLSLLTEKQEAELLGVSASTLRRWRAVGEGPHFTKLGATLRAPVRYRADWNEEYLSKWLRCDSDKAT